MPTFSDSFDRADGSVGSPWVNYEATGSVPIAEAAVVSNQLTVYDNGAALVWINPGTETRRQIQHLAFDFVSQSLTGSANQWSNPPIMALWASPNGQWPAGILTRRTLQCQGDEYHLTGATFTSQGVGPAIINPGDRVDVTYRATGQLIIRVAGVVKLNINIFEMEASAGIFGPTSSWRQKLVGPTSDHPALHTVIDNFTVTYSGPELRSRPSTRRAYFSST